jgi:phenylacetate-CoA ligase
MQLQIVQERKDFLVLRVVKGESSSEQTVRDIERLALERFCLGMHIAMEYVASIQSETSGKYRFCISKIPNPFG